MLSSFRFHTSTQYINPIRIYGHHLLKDTTKICIISASDNKPLYGLSVGSSLVPYKSSQIEIEIDQSKIFKGGNAGLSKWIDIYITIKSLTRDQAEEILNDFIHDAINMTQSVEEFKLSVQIYEPKSGWRHISNLPKRPIDTIYLDSKVKENLLSDINNFINEEPDYLKFGIPYKRCYLFHGKPGSGKTSSIFALASLLKKNISVFNFSRGILDTVFISAVSQLGQDRFLVLEDLDSLFINRTPTDTNNVSFSALLNVLDGACRKNGLITFITCNDISFLDPALLRPGRVDYMIKFEFPSKGQIKQMYDKFLPQQSHNFDKFYQNIRGKRINMSLIQKFLFEHRKNDDITQFDDELTDLIIQHQEKEKTGYT